MFAACFAASASVAWAQGAATELVPAQGPLTTCLASTSKQPVYPDVAAGAVVRVVMRFDSANEPPRVDVKFNNGGALSEKAVLEHVGTYRLPCLKPGSSATASQEFQFVSPAPATKVGEKPIVAAQKFLFAYEGYAPAQLKPKLALVQSLTLVKDMNSHKVRFDLTTMGCPFEVDVTAYTPYMPNGVGEVGPRDPNRREFLEWLRAVTFEFPPAAKRTAIGSSSRITVPCAVLDFS